MATPTKPGPKTVEINGKKFLMHRLTVWKSASIQKNLAAIMASGKNGLMELEDEKYIDILRKLLSSSVWIDEGARELSDDSAIEEAFAFDTESLYKLAYAVMEYNRFPFFDRIAAIGKEALKTSGLNAPIPSDEKNPEQLDMLEP